MKTIDKIKVKIAIKNLLEEKLKHKLNPNEELRIKWRIMELTVEIEKILK
jgi:uncharacterized protein YjaG (DUF416 family)